LGIAYEIAMYLVPTANETMVFHLFRLAAQQALSQDTVTGFSYLLVVAKLTTAVAVTNAPNSYIRQVITYVPKRWSGLHVWEGRNHREKFMDGKYAVLYLDLLQLLNL
jgi:hypothetical protein